MCAGAGPAGCAPCRTPAPSCCSGCSCACADGCTECCADPALCVQVIDQLGVRPTAPQRPGAPAPAGPPRRQFILPLEDPACETSINNILTGVTHWRLRPCCCARHVFVLLLGQHAAHVGSRVWLGAGKCLRSCIVCMCRTYLGVVLSDHTPVVLCCCVNLCAQTCSAMHTQC